MKKEISVIIPCYNVEKYIDRCVGSLVAQTIGIEKLECIFVDDASTDKTQDKLLQWEQKYPEDIMVICCEENRKQGAARNTGLQYASADYVSYVDADDYVSLDMYEKLYEKAEAYHCDVVGGLFVREHNDGTIVVKAKPATNADKLVCIRTLEERKRLLLEGLIQGVWGKIYRRKLILENELYFPEDIFYEDIYWGGVLLHVVSSYYIINEPFYHYMINGDSTIMKRNAAQHLDRLIIELMKLEEYKRRGYFETFHDEIEFGFLRIYYINSLNMFFTRLDEIPYEILYTMQQEVRRTFPDFKANPYLDRLNWIEQFFLKTVEMKLSEKDWEEIKQAYLDDIKEGRYQD